MTGFIVRFVLRRIFRKQLSFVRRRIFQALGIVLLLLVLKIVLTKLLRGRTSPDTGQQLDVPPGDLGLPYIGETLSYAKNPHQFFESRVSKYGPVFKTRILGHPVVCFTGPEAFTFFVNQASFDRQGANPDHAHELLFQNSLPLIDGPEHRQMRSAVMQAFGQESLDIYMGTVQEITETYLARWEGMGQFAWVDEFKRMSASISQLLLLGADSTLDTDELVETLDSFSAGLTSLPINLPMTKYGKALQSRDLLLTYIDEAIAKHRQQPYDDMLGALLKARSAEGSPLLESQLRAQMLHMFFAAYGNVFRVLTLMCLSLARNPGTTDRARKEVLDNIPEGKIALENLMRLTFLDSVTKEVRRHNRVFASTFFDWVTEDVEYGGYSIPKGWKATGGIFTTMQDESVFTMPGTFDPDRFSSGRNEDWLKENAYVPQGGGAMEGHRCPAEEMTTILMKLVGTMLLRDYQWDLLPQDTSLNDEPSPMPRDGLKVKFTRL